MIIAALQECDEQSMFIYFFVADVRAYIQRAETGAKYIRDVPGGIYLG
jgi:hypothetical protein